MKRNRLRVGLVLMMSSAVLMAACGRGADEATSADSPPQATPTTEAPSDPSEPPPDTTPTSEDPSEPPPDTTPTSEDPSDPETAVSAEPAGPLVRPLGPLPPPPGSCGDGSYDVPVSITDVVRGSAFPAWRPDCAEIAYQQHVNLLAMRPDGEHLRDLWLYWTEDGTLQGGASQPSWSPDGTRIAFAAENLGNDDPYWARHIWVMDADGSNAIRLTQGNHWDNSPSWSPDGSRIAFSRHRHADDDTHIVIIHADGSNEMPLTAGSARERYPSWSPDGADIAFVAEDGQLVLMAPDGSNQRVIVSTNAVEGITSRPDQVSWSPDS